MPKVLLVHPGTQHAPKLALQLYKHDLLSKFITANLFSNRNLIIILIKNLFPPLFKKFSNRIILDISPEKIDSFTSIEIQHYYNLKFQKTSTKEYLLFLRNKNFQEKIHKKNINDADLIIGFDTSSWLLSNKAHSAGKPFILDQTIAHPAEKSKVFFLLNTIYPEWRDETEQKEEYLIKLEKDEHSSADKIVVASTFTKKTLIEQGVSPEKIIINPYGVDLDRFFYTKRPTYKDKLVYLFIGSVSSRKGIPFLLDCWKKAKLGNSELWIVGPISNNIKEKIALYRNIKIFGKVLHIELQSIIEKANVFVFPSYFEGFGLVILEAMASGLPVITTTATGGPDIIENGEQGFIINPGDQITMIEHMEFFYKQPDLCNTFGKLARRTAEQFTWKAYGDRWSSIINETLKAKC